MTHVVAVVDANAKTAVVWHVDLGAETTGLSRMCGAWVIENEPAKLELLTRSRLLVATPPGQKALENAGGKPEGTIDVYATVGNIMAERDRLQEVFEKHDATAKSPLVPPEWPAMTKAIDVTPPPLAEGTGDTVAAALGIARSLEQLAVIWSGVERQRLGRPYLIDKASPSPRPCPVGIRR